METTIKIKSSSTNEIYDVLFKVDNNSISINCNCKAGLIKTLCKHRLSLIDGDYSAISDQNDITVINEIFNKIDKSKITDLFLELNHIEKEIKKLDLIKKKVKKELGIKFATGF
ncbi:hypothetical protein NLG42_05375 [Flavobacterium plurextorum]|uniref:hypothetical protein n=1 Tax=Flavobacterium TaxID=237 RepID=UPI00214DBA3E|nr:MULTISPECIES: hypothetical protein [Flavobacterium]UUW10235.1 hypothetical protein NLG42_05375 [Flavobacterium plurextorum]